MFCLVLITSLRAQERVRTSSQALQLESFRRSPEAFFYLGPFQEEVDGSLGVQYTDNVNLSARNKISDLSFFQALSLNTTWIISHLNQLQFNFGGQLTENQYGDGRQRTLFTVNPDSKIEFKFALSDVQVRVYDSFSYQQNPTQDPTATNTANLNSLTNTIGTVIDADLSLALLSLATDFTYNDQSGTSVQGQNNPSTTGTRESFRFGPTLTFRLSPTILYGMNVAATRTTSAHSASVNSLNLGPFINGKLTKEFEFDLSAGVSLVDTKPSVAPSYYYYAAIRYAINRHWQLLLSGSHDLIFTTGTALTEENVFRLGTRLDVTRFVTLTASPFVNFGTNKTNTVGTVQGDFTQFGIEARLTWRPRKRWSTNLTYDFTRLESGTAPSAATEGSYIQNSIAFSINYAF